MKTITVNASNAYHVVIGSGILSTIGLQCCQVCNAKKVCIVSDSNVFPLYGQSVVQSCQKAELEVVTFVFPAGEGSKNGTG